MGLIKFTNVFYVFLPRLELMTICLRDIPLSPDVDLPTLSSTHSVGYSGADIHIVCREAAMMPMRRLLTSLGGPAELSKQRMSGLVVPVVTMGDFLMAFSSTRPSVSQDMSERYGVWEREYGSR